ncbi:MAG: DUF115 domain-containing protein [Proteobacteria bacterium]|nr:DUF115 domain-containing protein [Pseudomonadota bacterium]
MDTFKINQEIIENRWPAVWEEIVQTDVYKEIALTPDTPESTFVISGIHLTSAYNRNAEARLQARLVPMESSSAWIYGFALGDLQRVLLEREAINELNVVVMNPALLRASLTHFDHTDWLKDMRIDLTLAASEASVHSPFAVAPACLRLAGDKATNLRDMLLLELARPFQDSYFRSIDEELDGLLAENIPLVERDLDVANLYGTAVGKDVVVVAGGPTAPDQFPWIKKKRDNLLVVAVSTALIPLQKAGINPNVVVVIDPKPVIEEHFLGADLDALKTTPLVYLPTVRRQVLELWTGPRLAAYIHRPRFVNLAPRLNRGFLFCTGTVAHTAIDLAVKMGASNVVLVGADFCFPRSLSHMEGAAECAKVSENGLRHHWVINGRGHRVASRTDLIGFLRDLELYIARHPWVTFINTGRDGAEIKGAAWIEE